MFCYTYYREVDSSLFVVGPFKSEEEARQDAERSAVLSVVVVRALYSPLKPAKKPRKSRKPTNKVG